MPVDTDKNRRRLQALQARADLLQARVLELESENRKLKRKNEQLEFINGAVRSSVKALGNKSVLTYRQ